MRIGIDVRLWNESGVGRYTRNLVKNLQILDKKNEYVLFGLNKDIQEILNQAFGSEAQARRVQNDNFRIVKANVRWHTLEEQLRLPAILNKERLDLVHFPYFSVPIFYNKPFVVTIHDLILHNFPTGLASTLPLALYQLKLFGYKFVISQAARRAEKIITVSDATKKEIVDHLGVNKDKVVVIYEGVETSSKFKVQSSKLQLKVKNYFLYVGNAYPHKNLDRLIEAFDLFCHPEASAEGSHGILLRQLADQNDTKLVLVGKEDYFYRKLKEKVKRMGLSDSIIFYGEATDEELLSLYKKALALVMPSLMEGFGLPALEAMANKCLVLASDIPSLREVCGSSAIYFNPYDIDDMVEKMKIVLLNDLNHFTKNINRGLERAKMFSWEKMARETLRVYESCAGV